MDRRLSLQKLRNISPDGISTKLATAEYALRSGDKKGACSAFQDACKIGQPYACKQATKLCEAGQ